MKLAGPGALCTTAANSMLTPPRYRPGPPLSGTSRRYTCSKAPCFSDTSALAMREPIEWKTPPLSIPSLVLRAPPPPPKESGMRLMLGSPPGTGTITRPLLIPGVHVAWASDR